MTQEDKPHFSLKTMSHISYKPAKKILDGMFKEITESHFGYRESWEVLIEVLGEHLGIIDQPWLYSDPNRNLDLQIDRLNPFRRSAFWVERVPDALNALASILGLPLRQPTIVQDQYHMSHEIYYEHRYKTVWKQYPRKYLRQADRAEKYLERFRKQGLLRNYVEKARAENDALTCAGWSSQNGPDHLGAIFEEFMLAGRANRMGQLLTPINVVDMMIMMLMSDKPLTKIESVQEPALGTGRMLIEYSRLNPLKPLVLYGIEVDLTLYRAALVNLALYSKHPYAILCANTITLDDTHHPEVWELANQWEPPDMEPFYHHFKPFKFSLKNLSDIRKEQSENSPTYQGIPVLPSPEAPQIPAFSLALHTKELHG